MPRELDEIYISVQARTEKAQEKLSNLAKSFDKTEESLKKQTKELSRRADLRKIFNASNKEEQKALRAILKANGESLAREKTLLKTRDKILESVKKYEKTLKDAKKDPENREAAKQVTQMQQLERYTKQVKAEQQDYYEFLRRAGMENARFSDRLDKRDRTRSLIENMRRGMDKGAAISMRFHAEENAIYRLERSIGIASSAFDRARHPAEALTDAFYSFQRITYTVQTILGVLFATIGDLVGGMMALAGVAGAAAGSLVAVAGAFANLAAGMVTAKFALSGVGAAVQQLWEGQTDYNKALRDAKKAFRDLRFEAEDAALSEQEAAIALEKAREALARVQDLPADSRARREAELEFQRAELNYRRAKARVKDTNDELKRGPQRNAAQNPFNNLTKSQVAFAKYLASLKPVVQSLKEAAASSFLPPLQKSIEVMVDNLIPALRDGLNSIGGALGDASRNFTDAFKDPENIKLFRDFLENSKPTLRILGAVAANAFGGILAILKAAQPITDRFARWVFNVSEGFEQLGKGKGQDNLKKFFKLAGDVASELGKAFKLVFGGFKNIVEATFPNGANSGAGGVILQWLKEIGAGFKLFTGTDEFTGWLKSATENSKVALGTLGSFLKIFLDLAASPDNKMFWMTIRDSVPYLRKILEDGLKAGPAFARLVNAIAAFIALLSESGAIQVFFETLTALVNTVTAFLRPFKPLLDLLGQAHGAFLALALGAVMFRKVAQIILGIMMKLTRVAGAATAGFLNLQGKLAAVRGEGNLGASSFMGMVRGIGDVHKQLKSLKLEATNLKRIEFLTELAKTDKGKRIAEIRAKMEALKNTTGNTKKATAELQKEIDDLNASYKRLKTELRAGAKDAKTFGDLLSQQAVKTDAATFSLDKYARVQDRLRLAGRVARGGLMTGVAVASGVQAATSGSVQGGFGAALMGVGGALSFAPGAGMIAGLGLSIVGSIVDGFDRANKEAEEAKEQKRVEIKARLAEITAEKISQTQTTIGAFVGRGASVEAATRRAATLEDIANTQRLKLGITESKASAEAIVSALATSDVLGDAAFKTGGTQKLTDAVLKLIATGGFTQESAIAQVEKAFAGRGGKTGLAAVSQLAAENANTRTTFDPTTGQPTSTKVTPSQQAASARASALAELQEFNIPRLQAAKDLVTDISKTGSDFKKRTALQKELSTILTEIDTKNKELGKLAGKTSDITKLLESTTFASGFYKGTNTFKGLGIPLAGQPSTQTGIFKNPQPFSSQFLDPKTKIYYDSSSEYQALSSGYLGELLKLVKENPTKTTIELKDKTGKLLVFDIDRSVSGGPLG